MRRLKVFLILICTLSCQQLFAAKPSGDIILSGGQLGSSAILAWSLTAENSNGGYHMGGGGSIGRTDFSAVSITRTTDATSPVILSLLATETNIPAVTISRDGLVVTMRRARITSYAVGGGSDDSEQLENVTVNFEQIMFEMDGSQFCWSVVENRAC